MQTSRDYERQTAAAQTAAAGAGSKTGARVAPHPAILVLAWLLLTIAIQWLRVPALVLLGALLVAVAARFSAARLYSLLRRTRWIALSLLLIYGYATPGEAIWAAGGIFSPTLQGLLDGLLQLARIVFMLSGLSIILSILSQQQLVGGIYTLAFPLRMVGLSRERIAVRLALTLHYAESALTERTPDWRTNIERMLAVPTSAQHVIEVHNAPFTLRDWLLLVAACALFALVWL